MLLAPQEAALFFKLHRSLMCFVNQRLQIVLGIDAPEEFSALSPEVRLKVRNALLEHVQLLERFVDENPFALQDEELDIVASWRNLVAGKFFIFRYLSRYAIFLATGEPPTAYGVVALSDPFEDLIGPYLPRWIETVLLPFGDKIVYDGLLSSRNITFGPGIRRILNEDYKAAKERLGIVAALPIGAVPAEGRKPARTAGPRSARANADRVRDALETVVGLTSRFCRDYLNEEYAILCRNLAEKLARKRPSPLLDGRPNTWACGIVRTVGWVNFLGDRSQRPYMKMTDIDKAFGVGESTGQGKSMLLRRMFKIRRHQHVWMLPSRMKDNPLIWMLEVNGILRDVRDCPREAQEIAFEKGLIPHIPDDGD